MKFIAYCAGICRNNVEPIKSAAGIVLVAMNNKTTRRREFGFPLGRASLCAAEAHAARLALLSIRQNFSQRPIKLHVSRLIYDLLEIRDGEYATKPTESIKEVSELRKVFSQYSFAQVVEADEELADFIRASELATIAVNNQTEYDSKTI